MQLTRMIMATVVLTLLAPGGPARGDFLPVDDQAAEYLFRYFSDADGVEVVSHTAIYDLVFANAIALGIRTNQEVVTIPAIAAPAGSDDAVDAITTASRPITGSSDAFSDYRKVRKDIQAVLDYGKFGFAYYISSEIDYFAQQIKSSYTEDFLSQNFYISMGGSYGWDAIDPVEDDDSVTIPDSRTTLHGNIVATQVLSPTAQIRMGVEANLVRGLQHSPYRNVYAAGAGAPERHPNERIRRAAFLRLNKYWRNRSSLKMSYRIYSDDWGINSHAIGARISQYVGSSVIVRYRYRYYEQTAADFYRPEYESADGINGYRTGDYRLEPLKSHLFGTRLSIGLGAFGDDIQWLSQLRFHINYERYFNDSNFSANVFETGLNYEF